MLSTLVLTRSYAGSLTSLLAVRYIDEPYQSLRDVLSDNDVGIIIAPNTLIIQYSIVSATLMCDNYPCTIYSKVFLFSINE